MPLIGAHVSAAGGLHKAFEHAGELNCEAMQVFTRNQRQWQIKTLSLQEIEEFYRAGAGSHVRSVISHCSYLINLAGNQDIRARSEAALIAEIERCHQLGIEDVVLHPGFAGDDDEETALKKISGSLAKALDVTGGRTVRILLETMAGQGSSLGGELRQFEKIFSLLGWHGRIGLCADTCHLFAAGYDIRTDDGYERLIAQIDNAVGYERVGCWHLNDSKAEKGSRKDRHTHLGQGCIGLRPFAMLMGDERFAQIPAILETPKEGVGDEGNLATLRKLRGF